MRHLQLFALAGGLLVVGCEDKTPPSWEGDGLLAASAEGANVRLSWPAAVDDELLEHVVLVDGEQMATVAGAIREYLVEGLDDATTYEMTVEAVDRSGNHSEPLHATVTTADETGPHWIAGAALRVEGEPPAAAPEEGEAATPEAERGPAVLEWDRAEDVGGVASYAVRRGATTLATVDGHRHELGRALEEGEREELVVVAIDEAGNESAPLHWRPEGSAPTVAQNDEALPADAVAAPPGEMPRVSISPSQSAIIERIRRMGLKRPGGLDRQRLRLDKLQQPDVPPPAE